MADVALWSGAAGANNGTSWANAYTTLAAVITAQGNNPTRIFVASDHVELTGVALTFQSSYASVYQVISCDRASGFPPTVEQAGARIGSTNATNLTLNNGFYSKGVFWTAGEGSTATRNLVFDSGTGYHAVRIVGGGIELRNTGSGSRFMLSTTATNRNTHYQLENAELRFGNAGQGIQMQAGRLSIKDGALAGSAITEFIKTFNASVADVDVSGLNMASGAVAMNLIASGTPGAGLAKFDSIKMPTSWTGSIMATPPVQGCLRVIATNVDSSDTNYRTMAVGWNTSLRTDTAIFRPGTHWDGMTPVSWSITTGSMAYPLVVFDTPTMLVWNETTGSPVTVIVHVLTDGVTLKDDEAWLEVMYLDDAGYPLGALVSDERPSQLAAAADQEASAAAWTAPGITTPISQKLSVTFTPREKGYIQARVRVARSSTTIYVCPAREAA